MRSRHLESHKSDRIGWLRAAVLGANDGIISIASLVVGIAASDASSPQYCADRFSRNNGWGHVDGGG